MPHHPAGDLPDTRRSGSDDTDTASAPRSQVVADHLVTAAVAEPLELGVQMDRVGESFSPAFVQVGFVGVEPAGPRLMSSAQQLFGDRGAGGAAHGVAAHVQFPGDLTDAVPLGRQSMDGCVAFADTGLDRRHFLLGIRIVGGGIVRQVISAAGCCLEAVVVLAHAAFDGGAEVLPEMEGIGDLDRVRGAGAGAVGVRTGPVTADDLRAGMFAQPAGQGRSVAAGQQVKRGWLVSQSMRTVP